MFECELHFGTVAVGVFVMYCHCLVRCCL